MSEIGDVRLSRRYSLKLELGPSFGERFVASKLNLKKISRIYVTG